MAVMTAQTRFKIQQAFPNIFNHYVSNDVSDATPTYNCIAWAYGLDTCRLWPDASAYGYIWPQGITNINTLDAFKELFASIGYLECENGDSEVGFIKIAIFANGDNPTHAARQQADGYWTSKLGSDIDLSHTIEGINNGFYGNAVVFMKRVI